MKRTIKKVLATVALATATVVPLGALPASAALSDCQSGYLCAWWDINYSGSKYQFGGNNTSWNAWAIADDDSSWYNHGTSGMKVAVYNDTNYTGGTTVCLTQGQYVAWNYSANDRGSSNQWNWGSC